MYVILRMDVKSGPTPFSSDLLEGVLEVAVEIPRIKAGGRTGFSDSGLEVVRLIPQSQSSCVRAKESLGSNQSAVVHLRVVHLRRSIPRIPEIFLPALSWLTVTRR